METCDNIIEKPDSPDAKNASQELKDKCKKQGDAMKSVISSDACKNEDSKYKLDDESKYGEKSPEKPSEC